MTYIINIYKLVYYTDIIYRYNISIITIIYNFKSNLKIFSINTDTFQI